jgi:hypothetical protein
LYDADAVVIVGDNGGAWSAAVRTYAAAAGVPVLASADVADLDAQLESVVRARTSAIPRDADRPSPKHSADAVLACLLEATHGCVANGRNFATPLMTETCP